MLIVCIGGARSGKSSFALELAREHDTAHDPATDRGGGVTFVATSPNLTDDPDLTERIAAHRAERPDTWRTIEETTELGDALRRAGDDFVVVDCLTLWVSNLMWRGDTDADIVRATDDAAGSAGERAATTVVVSNEVGGGVHPESDLGRRYRDLLGRVNQRWVARSDRALFLVAGRAIDLHDPRSLL
ncbi:MAG: bifunctional adenosylcobinamide kinase/adenosylcobinamide-phosphate guanylyltransferase [Ilumatobacteraceae bacterium]